MVKADWNLGPFQIMYCTTYLRSIEWHSKKKGYVWNCFNMNLGKLRIRIHLG